MPNDSVKLNIAWHYELSKGQGREGIIDAGVPVNPGRLVELLPRCTVTWQPGQQNAKPGGFEVVCPSDHRLGGAGEAVTQQHSGGPGAASVRLRVGVYRRRDKWGMFDTSPPQADRVQR